MFSLLWRFSRVARMSEGLRGCSDQRALDEEVPFSAIEHASIEVDTPVPGKQAQILLVIEHHLVRWVVSIDDILVVCLGEECFGSVHDFLKEIVGQVAVSHRPTEGILSSDDRDMATLKLAFGVALVCPCKPVVEACDLSWAIDKIVTLGERLPSVGIHKASRPLRSVILIEDSEILEHSTLTCDHKVLKIIKDLGGLTSLLEGMLGRCEDICNHN